MNQFPWRDFAWFTFLIGLAIGLAVELKRVEAMSGDKAQADRWEQQARAAAAKIAELSRTNLRLEEARNVLFMTDEMIVMEWVNVASYRDTRERSDSVVTGMLDLDIWLLMIVVIPLSAGIGIWLRTTNREGAKAYTKFSIQSLRWLTPLSVFMFASWAIACFRNAQPFFATQHLAFAVFGVVTFITHFHVTLTPELSNQIDEGFQKPDDFTAWWKTVARITLRDFFWFTLLIALSTAIVIEHNRAVEMSAHRGRGLWWQDAAEKLQAKLVEINHDPQHRIYRFPNTKFQQPTE
jgi:hypothetical protein